MQLKGNWWIGRSLKRFVLCGVLGIFIAAGLPMVAAIGQSTVSGQHQLLQGQHQFERGNFQAALEHWQQAETLFRKNGIASDAIGARLNQAKALQNLGFYRRAKDVLAELLSTLQAQPDSALKVNVMLDYGNILRLNGMLSASQQTLEKSLAIAQTLSSTELIQAAHLHLGNTLLVLQRQPEALQHFQSAAKLPDALQFSAQLQQLKLLYQLNRISDANALLPTIETHLASLPLTQLSLYGKIELASILSSTDSHKAAQLLATATQQAKTLGNRRVQSYAIGRLAALSEKTRQLPEAKHLTEQAMQLAKQMNVPEMLYQWEWQLGRILKTQGNLTAATSVYMQAVNRLRSLRKDLTGLGQDIQFSFRDKVEPVYRELVDLLLQPDASQANLQQARQVIESLQLAELNNFFREACLDVETQPIDEIDSTAAVIYPVILHDRLEVILSIPGQPLRHAATTLPRVVVEAGIQQMRVSLRQTAFPKEQLPAMQRMYQWIIQPIAADLATFAPKTLVFVLDGSLRNLPISALHDGKQYLIEQYQIAITPSLQLLSPRPFLPTQIHALVAGLSQETGESTPLPGVKEEIETIRRKIPAQVLLDRSFTTQAFQTAMNTAPFTLVHLATHGQFGANAEETFIQTVDGRLTVNDLQALLNQRSLLDKSALELLVLSACQTATGDNRAALGMAGLAVRSGARSTLATLWAVSDASTARFIAEFYTHLLEPQTSKATAVQTAQLALMRSKEFKNPFYWAPFILVGNWL